MCAASGPESIAVFAKVRFPDRTELLVDGLLDHAIQHDRNAERSHPSIGFGDFHGAHCFRFVPYAEQRRFDASPVFSDVRLGALDPSSIHARGPVIVPYLSPGRVQVLLCQHAFQRDRLHLHHFAHRLLSVLRPIHGLPPARRPLQGIHPGADCAPNEEATVVVTPRRFRMTARHAHRSRSVDRAFLLLWPFAPTTFRRPSSLLRPLLTAPTLSRQSSPRVRCMNFRPAPSGSTRCVFR